MLSIKGVIWQRPILKGLVQGKLISLRVVLKQRQKKKHKLHQLDQGRKTKGSYLQLISPTLYLLP